MPNIEGLLMGGVTQVAIAIFALAGAPLSAGCVGYRIFSRYDSGHFERLIVAGIAALATFNAWLDMCDKLLKAVS